MNRTMVIKVVDTTVGGSELAAPRASPTTDQAWACRDAAANGDRA